MNCLKSALFYIGGCSQSIAALTKHLQGVFFRDFFVRPLTFVLA